MTLNIKYLTRERRYISEHSYKNVVKEVAMEPVAIHRIPCGRFGAAARRFYYQADFIAPDDAEFVHDGKIRVNIVRDNNPHFKPKKFIFVGNVCQIV